MNNQLFSVVEFAPTVFEKSKQTGFQYRLTLIMCKEEPDIFFLTSPGFRPPLPVETQSIETIIEIVFSDLLIDIFHTQEFAVIGRLLRQSPGRLGFSLEKQEKIKDSIVDLSKNTSHGAVFRFFQALLVLAKAVDTTKMPDNALLGSPAGCSQVARRLKKVKKFVAENYRTRIKMSEAAEITGFSEAHFSRFFKQHTGMNFNDYVNTIRVEEAARLLLKTDDTISGIAYSCGFNTPNYFNDVFKKHKGKTPGEARIIEN